MISFLQMSLSAAALTAAVCLFRAAFMKKLPRRTFKLLWAVVILRMLLPISLPLMKISAGISFPDSSTAHAILNGGFTAEAYSSNVSETMVYEVPERGGVPFSAVRLIGAAVVFGYFAISHIRFRMDLGEAVPLEDPKISELAEKFRAKRKVPIKVSDRISSPLTCGVLRPVIILPKSLLLCGEKNAEYILAHEFTHIRRLDVLYKWAMTAAVCLHWFNPLAWIMFVLAERDIELSCDEEVILAFGGEREEYALALIGMEERRSFGAFQSGFGGSSVTERIKAAMTVKKATPAGKAAAALLALSAGIVFTIYDIEPDISAAAAAETANYCGAAYTDWVWEGTESSDDTQNYIVTYTAETVCVIETADAVSLSAEAIDGALNGAAVTVTVFCDYIAAEDSPQYSAEYTAFSYGCGGGETWDYAAAALDPNGYSSIDFEEYVLKVGIFPIYNYEDGYKADDTAENGLILISN